jgi:hypothetical protein
MVGLVFLKFVASTEENIGKHACQQEAMNDE